jgi:hypothetical protein
MSGRKSAGACLMHMVRQIRKVAGTEPAIERSARVGLKEDHHVLGRAC